MRHSSQGKRVSRLGIWPVAVIVFGILLLAVFSVPDDRSVAKRLLTDEAFDRLAVLSARRRQDAPELNADHAVRTLHYLDRLLLPSDWTEHLTVLERLVSASEDAGGVLDALRSGLVSAPEPPRAVLALALSRHEEGSEQLRKEARIFARSVMPAADHDLTLLVEAFRAADDVEHAFALTEHYLGSIAADRDPGPAVRQLFLKTALEADRAQDAWELASDSQRSGDASHLLALAEFAEAAGKSAEAIPILENALREQAQGEKEGKLLPPIERMLARFYEWNGRASDAFELHAKLALAGDSFSRTRCLELNPGLYRNEQLTRVLLAAEEQLSIEERSLLADLLRTAGRIDEAESQYRLLSTLNPQQSAEVDGVLGQMLSEAGRVEEGIEILRQAYHRDPENIEIGGKLGELLVQTGAEEDALAHYASMPRHNTVSATALQYLATAHGDRVLRRDALALKVRLSSSPVVTPFIELAEAHMLLGEFKDAERVILEGEKSFPESRELRLRHVSLLAVRKDFPAALEVLLSQQCLQHDPVAVAKLDEINVQSDDYSRILRWLGGPGVEDRIELSEAGRALLADIYLDSGRLTRARRLVEVLPEIPAFSGLRASLAFREGRLLEAERHQAIFVKTDGRARPEAWTQLGRLRNSLGRVEEARENFAMALALISERK